MQKVILLFLLFIFLGKNSYAVKRKQVRPKSGKCAQANASMQKALKYAKKAYNSESLDELHYDADRLMRLATDAQREAHSCGCAYAESAAADIYNYTNKAYIENRADEAKDYMRRAKGYCEDAVVAVNECER